MTRSAMPLLLSTACVPEREGTRPENDTDSDTVTDLDIVPLVVTNLATTFDQCGFDTAAISESEALEATQTSASAADVSHTAHLAQCCAEFVVTAALDTATNEITVDYEDIGEECDCMCPFAMRYTMGELPPGDYQVHAPEASTNLTMN